MGRTLGFEIMDLSFGLVIGAATLLGGMYCLRGCLQSTMQAYREVTEHNDDLNGDGSPETFLRIGDRKYFYSVDGVVVQERLRPFE